MIKKSLSLLLIALFAMPFSSCEKDDICAASTPTTPRLVIEFFNSAIPSDNKNVSDLSITATGETDSLTYNSVSKIFVPLKTTDDTTEYKFTIFASSDDATIRNTDNLVFNYARNSVYISRACGFKTVFITNAENGVVRSNPDDTFWIKSIQVV